MEPAITVGLAWLLFGGTHVGLASRTIRAPLVGRFGEWGYITLFAIVASASFTLLVGSYATHRFEGGAGPALGQASAVRWALSALVVAGLVLMALALWSYPASAYAPSEHTRIRPPRGVERITRHPFFAGMTMLALAHALLATRLVGVVFFGGFLLLSTLGPVHQSRKLLARHGQPFRDYLDATSAVPLAAIMAGRQKLVWKEIPGGAVAAGLALAWLLTAFHADIFAFGGLYVIVTFVGGAAILIVQTWRRDRRAKASASVRAASGTGS
jgi:uncharacterized membrane protein